jgi:tetraacyldisaccharide 4'-kinase
MLAKNLPGAVVLTDRDRIRAGQFAIGHFGCDTLILDDGFQYLRLRGQLNLLLIDRTNPFGRGHLLPRGILREPPEQLARASHIFLTKSDGTRDERLESLIRRHRTGQAPILECRHSPRRLQDLHLAEWLPIGALAGRRVAAFSGIAVPESFESFLKNCGAILVHRRRFPDHYRFTEEDIAQVFENAQLNGAEWVITTEKDAVRLSPNWFYPLRSYFLRIEVEILRGREEFQSLIDRICGGEPPPRKELEKSDG